MLNSTKSPALKGVEVVELVYDADSDDPKLNWNLRGGISGGLDITHDLTMYDSIDVVPRIYPNGSLNTGGWSGVYRLDLKSVQPDNWAVAGYAAAYSDEANGSKVSGAAWLFTLLYNVALHIFKWHCRFGSDNYNNNATTVIRRIYGRKILGGRKAKKRSLLSIFKKKEGEERC